MRYEFQLETVHDGWTVGAYDIAAEFETYQGGPSAVYVEGTKFRVGTVACSIDREWIRLTPYGDPYIVGLHNAVQHSLLSRSKEIAAAWAEYDAEVARDKAEHRNDRHVFGGVS